MHVKTVREVTRQDSSFKGEPTELCTLPSASCALLAFQCQGDGLQHVCDFQTASSRATGAGRKFSSISNAMPWCLPPTGGNEYIGSLPTAHTCLCLWPPTGCKMNPNVCRATAQATLFSFQPEVLYCKVQHIAMVLVVQQGVTSALQLATESSAFPKYRISMASYRRKEYCKPHQEGQMLLGGFSSRSQ